VFARRYDASGPLGPEFLVNAYTTDDQTLPQVASLSDGSFLVVWQDAVQDGDGFGVFGRRFDAGGVAGPEFRINTHTTGPQASPTVSVDAAGRFIVVWHGYGPGADGYAIYARRYDLAGDPEGAEFRVNSYDTGPQTSPSVARDPAGNFVVSWRGPSLDGAGYHVFARRFDPSGAPTGAEVQVNGTAAEDLDDPSVAIDAGGRFVVAWTAYEVAGSSVFARRFAASGTPRGDEFRVHAATTDAPMRPSVASDAASNFVVAWQTRSEDGSQDTVFARTFDASGTAVGDEFRLNTYPPGEQRAPAVATDAGGRFVAVWEGYGQDGDSNGVFGRHFLLDTIFRDGFEPGS
jgi:hypothetical protein